MKAAQLVGLKTFRFVDVETPRPAAGECLIRLEALSVCGSDIYLEWGRPFPESKYPLPVGAPCHECAGVVVESRTPEVKEGERVIVIPRQAAGLAEYVVQTPERIIKLPQWGSLEEWVMCQHTGTVLFSAKRWGNPAGKRIAVLGQGGIGLSFTMIAGKQGALQVIGLDLEDYRLRKALELGATHTINPANEDAKEALEEITGGAGLDVVVDASGNPAGLATCIDLVRPRGTVIGFSLITPETAVVRHWEWMSKQVTLIPTVIALTDEPVKEIRETVALRDRGWFDPALLKTHRMTFDEIPSAYEMYANRADGVIKVVMAVGS